MKKLITAFVLLGGTAFANVTPPPSEKEACEPEKAQECVCIDGKPSEENSKLRQEISRLNVENRAFRALLKKAKILK